MPLCFMSCGKLIFLRSVIKRTFSCLYQMPNPIPIAIHEMDTNAMLTQKEGAIVTLILGAVLIKLLGAILTPESEVDRRKWDWLLPW